MHTLAMPSGEYESGGGNDVIFNSYFRGVTWNSTPKNVFKCSTLSRYLLRFIEPQHLRPKIEAFQYIVCTCLYSGTSGDTGSAAIEGVRGQANMDIVVLLPKGHCTLIQELQMTTVLEDNVHVYCGQFVAFQLMIEMRVYLDFKRYKKLTRYYSTYGCFHVIYPIVDLSF